MDLPVALEGADGMYDDTGYVSWGIRVWWSLCSRWSFAGGGTWWWQCGVRLRTLALVLLTAVCFNPHIRLLFCTADGHEPNGRWRGGCLIPGFFPIAVGHLQPFRKPCVEHGCYCTVAQVNFSRFLGVHSQLWPWTVPIMIVNVWMSGQSVDTYRPLSSARCRVSIH